MRKFLKYLIVFVPAMALLYLLNKPLEFINFFVYKNIYLSEAKDSKIDNNIILIELPRVVEGKELEDYDNFRLRLVDLLKDLRNRINDNGPPAAVIIDFHFTKYSGDSTVLKKLKFALKLLRIKGTKIFATYPMNNSNNLEFYKVEQEVRTELYDDKANYFQDGRLHTQMINKHGVLFYLPILKFSDNKPANGIKALPLRVAEHTPSKSEMNLRDYPNGYVLPVGDTLSLYNQTFKFEHEKDSISNGILKPKNEKKTIPNKWNGKYVIIGDFDLDTHKSFNGHKGPQLVAWALNDQLKDKDNSFAKQPFDIFFGELALVFFMTLIVVGIFLLIFNLIKFLQTRPIIIALLSFSFGLIILIGIGFAILNFFNEVLPVFYVSSSMMLTSIFAWHYSKQILIAGIAPGGEIYDLFISYNRKTSQDWVIKNVFEPLEKYRKKDGSELKIFFDKKSIKNSNAFAFKYTRGVQDSKLFLPICSEGYKSSNHCMNELSVAYTRHFGTPSKIKLFIIAFNDECVPSDIEHLSWHNKDEEFMNDLLSVIDKSESKQPDKPETIEVLPIENQEPKQPDKPETIEPMELDNQDSKPTDKLDSIEEVNLEHQEAELSEKEEMVRPTKKDKKSEKKDKKEKEKKVKKNTKKKDKKKEKKKSKKEDKEINKKKAKKEEKEKAKKKDKKTKKKSNKKDKKEKEKNVKKSADKKAKKINNKKTKKSSDKKIKKAKKKKGKKS